MLKIGDIKKTVSYKKVTLIAVLTILSIIVVNVVNVHAASPVLLFSDITTGPKTGWEGSPTKGAAVTVWGLNFGSIRGSSYITINGTKLSSDSDYAEWGETTNNAKLDAHTQLQRITFFLNSNIGVGSGKITVSVNGENSSGLDFTITQGRGSGSPGSSTDDIWFVDASTGNDASNGQTAVSAWKTTVKANPRNNSSVGLGDIVYIRAGTYSVIDGDGAAFKFYGNGGYDGTSQRPRAWLGYPGDDYPTFTVPIVASYRGNSDDWMDYLIFSKLKYAGNYTTVFLTAGKGQRIVGCLIEGTSQNSQLKSAWIAPFGPQDTFYLGNVFKNGGYDNFGHVIYPGCKSAGSSAQDVDNLFIGYNEIDNFEGDQASPYGGAVFNFRNKDGGIHKVDNVYIYNNYMHDSDYAQFFWTEEGNMHNYYIYNNLVTDANGHGTHLADYLLYAQTSGIMHIYNNTFYDGGGALAFVRVKASGTSEAISKNNIYISTNDIFFEATDGRPIDSDHDVFYGYATPTSGGNITVTNAITGKPEFINEAGGNFRLASSDTVAVDAGTSSVNAIVSNDLVSISRPGGSGYDIGAFELDEAYVPPVPDTEAPTVPSSVSATAVSSTQINLSWNASTDNVGVAGYRIYRGGAQIASTTATSYSNTNLNPSTSYTYTVKAYDAAGNSATSSSVSATTQDPPPDTAAPSIPAGLNAVAASSTQINLTWSASTDNVAVTGYKVFRGGIQIDTSASTSYSDTGLSPSTTYTYTVSAYDAARNTSSVSAPDSATTLALADSTPPTIPNGINAVAQSDTVIDITWNPSTDNVGVTGYKIYRNGVHIDNSASTSYVDINLKPWKTFTYTLKAYDAANNESGSSAPDSDTTYKLIHNDIAPKGPKNLRIK